MSVEWAEGETVFMKSKRRMFLVTVLCVIYSGVLILAWNFGPTLFQMPVMTFTWVAIVALALLLGIPCGIFRVLDLRRFRREQRLAHNCCTECGYDLRATKDRCPECGMSISVTIETKP